MEVSAHVAPENFVLPVALATLNILVVKFGEKLLPKLKNEKIRGLTTTGLQDLCIKVNLIFELLHVNQFRIFRFTPLVDPS